MMLSLKLTPLRRWTVNPPAPKSQRAEATADAVAAAEKPTPSKFTIGILALLLVRWMPAALGKVLGPRGPGAATYWSAFP